ncbi:MAG: hypothetical protein H6878_12080 [Rhodobiaceae bacterium]|nr:hypothetical protein [Rhodobiaceae bacterium]MCC0016999.1 hypothetical protein [Rhodobiaceae bacterium]MCC0041528.1 hypothetical protein [Rhodobiaceae bacterium]MCC0053747.1 hypothetical protein [Rhodobiaceae bacterium]
MAQWHAFLIEGRNFRSDRSNGAVRPGRIGFYTWRFIEAADEETARRKAEEDVFSAARERFPDSPRGRLMARPMGMREAPQMSDYGPGMRGTGFILFPETPVVSEIAAAFEGVASFFRPAANGGTTASAGRS